MRRKKDGRVSLTRRSDAECQDSDTGNRLPGRLHGACDGQRDARSGVGEADRPRTGNADLPKFRTLVQRITRERSLPLQNQSRLVSPRQSRATAENTVPNNVEEERCSESFSSFSLAPIRRERSSSRSLRRPLRTCNTPRPARQQAHPVPRCCSDRRRCDRRTSKSRSVDRLRRGKAGKTCGRVRLTCGDESTRYINVRHCENKTKRKYRS